MSFIGWMTLIGALLMTMALSSALIQRLPISTAAIYLGVGCAIGPWGFDLLRIDLMRQRLSAAGRELADLTISIVAARS